VRVVDDGCGIDADDLPLALASHATSKLQDTADLFRVGTLGFRSEALESIGEHLAGGAACERPSLSY
jgi:DNA mismatch repair protein MutL